MKIWAKSVDFGFRKSAFHRTHRMRWNHRFYSYLFFLGYSTDTKDEADDDDNECRNQKHVIVFEEKERTNSRQHQ